MRKLRGKTRVLGALAIVAAVVASLAMPAGAATFTAFNYRDINSPLDSCAYSTTFLHEQYVVGTGWEQDAGDAVQWFHNDPGCAYPATELAKPAHTLSVYYILQCSLDGGLTAWNAYTSPTVYNVANAGDAGWDPGYSTWCGAHPVTQPVSSRVIVHAGYLIGTTWFTTSHTPPHWD